MDIAARDFKATLGRFASGVTVIATRTETGVHGMTASAFLSVSLDPQLVLVSVAKKAQMHAHLLTAPRWSVSILAHDQAALSNHFAGYGAAAVQWLDPTGTPHLHGAIGWVVCSTFAIHDAGDHSLFVGRAEDLGYSEGEPLVYAQGKYRALAPVG
jgi:flavin reductase (DIM6/NTAB) family NADH-FMN oxidoreductase RutF